MADSRAARSSQARRRNASAVSSRPRDAGGARRTPAGDTEVAGGACGRRLRRDGSVKPALVKWQTSIASQSYQLLIEGHIGAQERTASGTKASRHCSARKRRRSQTRRFELHQAGH